MTLALGIAITSTKLLMCFARGKWSAEDLRAAGSQHPDYYVPGTISGPTCHFDFRPWLEDFGQLTAEKAAHYANLESSQRAPPWIFPNCPRL